MLEKGGIMSPVVTINRKDANMEILARIVKSTSKKYGCSMNIDFSGGRRLAEFVGDSTLKPFIVEEVESLFKKDQH